MSEISRQNPDLGQNRSLGLAVPKLLRDVLNTTAGKATGFLALVGLTAGTVWHTSEKQFENQQGRVERVSRPTPLTLDVLEGLSLEENEKIFEELRGHAEVFVREITEGELHKIRDIADRLKDDKEAIRDVAPLMEINSDLRKSSRGMSQILTKHPDALPHLLELTKDAFVRQEEEFKIRNKDMAPGVMVTAAAGYDGTLKMLQGRTMEANLFPMPSQDLLDTPAFRDAVRACAEAYLEQDTHLANIREKQLLEFARKYSSDQSQTKQ